MTMVTGNRSGPAPAQTVVQALRRHRLRKMGWAKFKSILYHTSLWFFILVIACLLVGSAYELVQQAVRTGGKRRWNVFVLVATYVVMGLISIVHVWSRLLSIKKVLRTMPKPYMPTKQIDVPKSVANHIMTEYSRTAVIAHISQATTGQQEGWGRPGTKWENTHFRTFIVNTLPTMWNVLCPGVTAPPLSVQPLLNATGSDNGLRLMVMSYIAIIDRARYAKQEPMEHDAEACEKIVSLVATTMRLGQRQAVAP